MANKLYIVCANQNGHGNWDIQGESYKEDEACQNIVTGEFQFLYHQQPNSRTSVDLLQGMHVITAWRRGDAKPYKVYHSPDEIERIIDSSVSEEMPVAYLLKWKSQPFWFQTDTSPIERRYRWKKDLVETVRSKLGNDQVLKVNDVYTTGFLEFVCSEELDICQPRIVTVYRRVRPAGVVSTQDTNAIPLPFDNECVPEGSPSYHEIDTASPSSNGEYSSDDEEELNEDSLVTTRKRSREDEGEHEPTIINKRVCIDQVLNTIDACMASRRRQIQADEEAFRTTEQAQLLCMYADPTLDVAAVMADLRARKAALDATKQQLERDEALIAEAMESTHTDLRELLERIR